MNSRETNRHNYIPKYFQERIQEAKDKKLKQLDLSSCYFSRHSAKLVEVFGYISELEQLEVLNLSNNQLTSMPESISKLSNLTELDLKFNQLTSMPESISKLSNLTKLDLTDNPLEIPLIEIAKQGIERIRKYLQPQEIIQEAKDKNLNKLDLSSCYLSRNSAKLAEIFGYISELEQLEVLNLSNNQLTSMPESISKLSNLTELDLKFNQLTSLPESMLLLAFVCLLFIPSYFHLGFLN
ncbi:MAG: hypothetical protein F6K40_38830 [Okeania sp. SIO3I5]|uniref:leucine-rich repeat domain-containing protein n=1 Tax=Okeania sp. SIO3I5 TaxID=2607805 RepID=UPI0013BA4EE9|nr:leucine-rich repeat domain-containing protein [Okeania sp. SIO3I5]NEQ41819.1 hypothetical protein [Okeania sp. SIO3I5]